MYILYDSKNKCYYETMVDSPVFPYVGFVTLESLLKFYEMKSLDELKSKLYPHYIIHKIRCEVEEVI